jgi:hypothetical protein
MNVIMKTIWLSLLVAAAIAALQLMDDADDLRFPNRSLVD